MSESKFSIDTPVGSEDFKGWHRVTILHDGVEILGATVTAPRPTNHEEMTDLLRGLYHFSTAPIVPDPEVLGKYSPCQQPQTPSAA